MGLRKIELDELKRREIRKKGAILAIDELEDMVKSIKELHKKLEKMEKKYGNDFASTPEASERLMKIREELGLPEEIGVFERKTKPGITDKITGGGFYEDLALRVLELGKDLREKNGGIMSTAEVIIQLNKKYKGLVISISDIIKAIKVLTKNKLVTTRKLNSGVKIVEFVQWELIDEHERILALATQRNGEITLEEILIETKWTFERAESIMKFLEDKNITERHQTLEGIKFIFYGL